MLTLEDGYDKILEHSREGTKKARMTGKLRKRANKKVENLRKKCLTNESVHGKILERSRELESLKRTRWSGLTANEPVRKKLEKSA
mgnify:CR=1 FL=1